MALSSPEIKDFDDLSSLELYQSMQLREVVFTFEQKCPDPDFDGADVKALHIFMKDQDRIVAYGRFFKPGDYYDAAVSFGRFLVAKEYRGKGIARQLFQSFLDYSSAHFVGYDVMLSAQVYIRGFYESFGFKGEGEIYKEADIDHIKMVKSCCN